MNGWLAFIVLALAVGAIAWVAGDRNRSTAMLIASALSVAAAGYAWQGSPGLPGRPAVAATSHGLKPDTLFATERARLLNPYGEAGQWLTFADGLNRAGEDQAAVSVLTGAVARFPDDVALRIGLAHALLVLADYRLTPAVQLAFAQAEARGRRDPAVAYFEGLAAFEAGDPAETERQWRTLVATLPPASPWRRILAEKLAPFDRLRAEMTGRPAAR